MAKKHLGIVLTTRRYDMYRFVVYQYEDTTMVNTCPLCLLLRAVHAYSRVYMEEQREIRGYVPRRRWFNLDNRYCTIDNSSMPYFWPYNSQTVCKLKQTHRWMGLLFCLQERKNKP